MKAARSQGHARESYLAALSRHRVLLSRSGDANSCGACPERMLPSVPGECAQPRAVEEFVMTLSFFLSGSAARGAAEFLASPEPWPTRFAVYPVAHENRGETLRIFAWRRGGGLGDQRRKREGIEKRQRHQHTGAAEESPTREGRSVTWLAIGPHGTIQETAMFVR